MAVYPALPRAGRPEVRYLSGAGIAEPAVLAVQGMVRLNAVLGQGCGGIPRTVWSVCAMTSSSSRRR
jgi:hypothetical protein